jgi:hypothetical protein
MPQSAREMHAGEAGMIMRILGRAIAAVALLSGAAQAREGAMERVVTCKGPDASMEIYVPEDALTGAVPPKGGVIDGLYALDLSGALKGKHLERVHITESPDHKGIVVNQYTRGLPTTTIPKDGGTVNFDNRFGTHAVCGKFGA